MLKRRCCCVLFLIYFALLAFSGKVYAETVEKDKTIVILIIDRINIEDLDESLPNINFLLQNGSCALMNVRTASSRYDTAGSYLTIGTGTRAYAGKEAEEILYFEEKLEGYQAGKLFESISGKKPEPGNMLIMKMQKLINNNERLNQKVILGLLGEYLKDNGIAVTLLGNADVIEEKSRWAGLIGMDKIGIVERSIEGKNIEDKNFPFLLRTDYKELFLDFLNSLTRRGLIVIELGDTLRLDRQYHNISREKIASLRKEALSQADEFIGNIIDKIDIKNDLLLVLTPSPSSMGNEAGNLLTPLIAYGGGFIKGYVFSVTTRRPGLVTNLDIVPTILDFFKIEPVNNLAGSPFTSLPQENSFSVLLEKNKKIVKTYKQRALIIKPFVACQVFLSLAFMAFLIFRKNWLKYLRPFFIGSISIPFILLILPLIPSSSLWQKYLWILFLAVIITWAFSFVKSSLKSVSILALFTAGGILLDLLCDSPLMKDSILGYDPIGGSRYYGLGNEYMGILVGSLIIGLTALFDEYKIKKRTEIILGIFFSLAFFLIISPAFGSNLGGGISSLGAFLFTLYLLKGKKIKIRDIFIYIFIVVVLITVIFLIISPFNPPSHISKTWDIIRAEGISSIIIILKRKLLMNIKLIRYTVWTRALLTSFLVLAYLLYRPPYILKQIFLKYPNLYRGYLGAGFGLILVLLFNDSGIVASATLMIFLALPAMLLVSDKNNVEK